MNAQMPAVATLPARTQIAVVGAGPVGLIAAIELARHGLQPVVLDAKDGIAWSSRATCISRRSLEILDRIGAGPAFAVKALPWSQGRTFHRDRLVFRLDMPHGADDRHAPFVNLQQFYTEQFLLDRLRALGGDVHWGHRVTGITTDPGSVTLALATPEGGTSLRADWVVAADGGRSTVREQMGLDLHGTAYESRYLIADIEVEGVDRPVERNVWFDPPSNPGSTVILHVQPDRIWRIDYQLRDEEDAEAALREENVRARLQAQLDMMGITAPWRLVWRSLYKALALSLESYRHDRVLFAGDAAHLVPIFGVRGLNSGIDDAHNLGWKLAMVARHKAPSALLDSYHHERRRATRENHAQATKSTWFMSPPSAGFRIMRDAVLCLAAEHPWASTLINPRQSAAHVYDDSPVVQPDALPSTAGIAPGAPVPNLRLPTGDLHLHDMLAPLGFTLLVFLDRLGAGADALPALADMNLHIVRIGAGQEADVIDGQARLAERFAAEIYAAYLVRPDQHVAARFAGPEPSAVAAALEIALARTQASQPAGAAAVEPPVLVPPPNSPGGGTLGQDGLERVFAAVSHGIDAAGGPASAAFLARLTLLLAAAVGDADRVLAAVDAARAVP